MRYVVVFTILLVFRLILFYLFPLNFYNGQHVGFTATLLENPVLHGEDQTFHLRMGTFWQGVEIVVQTKDKTHYTYGQEVEVNGTILNRVLNNKNIAVAIQNPQIKAKNSGFLPLFGSLRQKIINFCENNFSQPYSGLIVGIIFGIKSELTDQITRSFRITGLSHVVAASGMNVTLVAGFLFTALGSFLRRQEAIVLSIFGIFLYVCISGFDAPIVRAALMGSVAFSAPLFGRQYSPIYILICTGTAMLLWDPLLLLNVGFQLSFLATVGILLLKPVLFGNSFLMDDFTTTLSAQIATLPILLSTFGQYSLLSILANILVLWTIPLITIIGAVGVIIGLIFEPLGKLIVALIFPLVWYLQQVTYFFSNHPFLVTLNGLPILFVASYYCFIGVLYILLKKRRNDESIQEIKNV